MSLRLPSTLEPIVKLNWTNKAYRKAMYLQCRRLATITNREMRAAKAQAMVDVLERNQQHVTFQMLQVQMNLLSIQGYTIC